MNGQTFKVIIDTGSSDLWIKPSHDFSFSGIAMIDVEEGYAGGVVSGTIGFASMQLGGYSFENQVFMNATTVDAHGIIDIGLDGVLGLSFNGATVSPLLETVIKNGYDSSLVKPFLFNIFDQTPQQDNFIGISLSRSADLEGSADASFTINEVDEAYAEVLNAPVVPVFNPTNLNWNILIDAIDVDGANVSLPVSIAGAPDGKLVAVMDTGTPAATLPSKLLDGIYSAIPVSVYHSAEEGWLIPCNTTTLVTVWIGGQPFPIHPLDLSTVIKDPLANNIVVCATPFSADPGAPGIYDMILGDSFMRNVYSIFNFGDSISGSPTANASMQLLSQTNINTTIMDVLTVRVDSNLLKLSEGPSNSTGGGPAVAAAALNEASPASGDASGSQVNKYAPIVIGLLGGNLLVGLILLVLGVMACLKRNEKKGGAKYVPVRVVNEETNALDDFDTDKRYSD
ncbi:aspartic peptidase domain-containing protein [Mycena filopes]|nr:aspartic peptidase domain-containing protein [Mycena filopes]